MRERVIDILAEVLKIGRESIGDDFAMQDCVAWDSLRHMELIAAIEAELGRELSFDQIISMTSLAGIREVVDGVRQSEGA